MWFYLTVCLLIASAQAKFYSDCGSTAGTVDLVEVSGCKESAAECVLKRDTNATIGIEFTPSKEVKSLTTVVHGVIMNLPVPFPLPQPDACKESGFQCPVKSGAKVSYKSTLPVLKSYPKVRVDIKWELQLEDKEDVVCILMQARIK